MLLEDAEGCLACTTATKNIFSTAVLFQAPNDPGYPVIYHRTPGCLGANLRALLHDQSGMLSMGPPKPRNTPVGVF